MNPVAACSVSFLLLVSSVIPCAAAPRVPAPRAAATAPTSFLANGDFEAGSNGAWVELNGSGNKNINQLPGQGHNGSNWFIYAGIYDFAVSTTYQDLAIPAGTQPYLQFWYKIVTTEGLALPWDVMKVQIDDPAAATVKRVLQTFSSQDRTSDWVQSPRYDLSEFAGQTIRLDFQVQNDYSHPTTFQVDDVFVGVGGSSNALNVTIGGSGTGMVVSTPAAIACNSSCSSTFDAGTAVTLVATPTPPATFAGWSGDCTGMGNCLLTMDGSKAVIASFAVDAGTIGQPTRIMGAVPSYYPGLAEAYSAAKSGDLIQARSTEFVTNLDCALDKAVTISGGFDSPYATQSGITRIHGTLSVDRGSLTVDRVEIY